MFQMLDATMILCLTLSDLSIHRNTLNVCDSFVGGVSVPPDYWRYRSIIAASIQVVHLDIVNVFHVRYHPAYSSLLQRSKYVSELSYDTELNQLPRDSP